jgi:methyl farnesoate epoxidase/farnesoate epoxidase
LLFANGENWKRQRRFTLRSLRDFGFGKSTIEHLILQEMEELAEAIHPDQFGAQPSFVHLDAALNATITNIIWWLMASEYEQD